MPPLASHWLSACLLISLLTLGSRVGIADEGVVDFEADIAPIFVQHCLRCHSDAQRKGELSLSSIADLRSATYIVAGDPAASYLLDVVQPDGDLPPAMPQQSPPLSQQEVQLLQRWIAQGASWPAEVQLEVPPVSDRQWWSLQPLIAPSGLKNQQQHPVDRLIDAQLQEQGLVAMERADPRTLIRRITYDLTGLPPSPEEIAAFLTEHEQDATAAWSSLVDRLLASPAFGEKFGQHWLDIARYADTHGYDKDKPRTHAWPYRDYVIRAFNADRPYARFVQEQVAGDALYPQHPDGVLGLGFLAAGPWDFIGHWEVGESKIDGRIAKHLDRDEMTSAVFNVFLSTTLQCAQCHHHKFDPIRMEDYYRLHAIFAAVDRADRVYAGLTTEQQQTQRQLSARIEQLEEEQKQLRTQQQQRLSERVDKLDQRMAELQSQYASQPPTQHGYHSQIASQAESTKWLQIDLGSSQVASEIRLYPAYDSFNAIGAGFGFPSRYRIEAANDPSFAADSLQLLLDATQQDQPNPKSRSIVIPAAAEPFRYVRITATKLALRQNDFIFALGEVQVLGPDQQTNLAAGATATALDSIEAPERWSVGNATDGLFYTPLSDAAALREFQQLESQREEIEQELRDPQSEMRLTEIQKSLDQLRSELDQLPAGQLVYAATTQFAGGGQFVATQGKPREIRLLLRGDIRSPAEVMLPGVPPLWTEGAGEFPATGGEADARANLAHYLTRPDNPLVWRSIANRLWQWVFGQPLVSTPNDFGRMGGLPSHPQLLDFLAAELRDDPRQSLKSIVRLLVTSQAYQRTTEHHAQNAARDAGNVYLWRAHRRRLTAEEFRDSLLAVSGVLRIEDRGGPSFQDFVIEKPEHSPHYQYHLHDADDPATHRRSVYRFVVRSQPQPMLMTLDCADPSISVPRRDESTTALQALTQWNDSLVETMSRHFAQRIQQPSTATSPQRIRRACNLAWGRLPTAHEADILQRLLDEQGAETLARVLFNASAFLYVE